MESKNIAIFGSSGAIGGALCLEYSKHDNIKNIFAFSRNGNAPQSNSIISMKVNYLDEKSLETVAQSINCKLDIIIIAIGALKNPEKSIKDLTSEKFIKMLEINTIPTALIGKYFLPILHRDRVTKFTSLSARVGSIDDNQLGGWYSYRASKAALNMILKNFSIEQKRLNTDSIIFGLHPGTVMSNLSKPFQKINNKYFTPEFSAKKLKNVIETKTNIDNGKVFAWDNTIIPF